MSIVSILVELYGLVEDSGGGGAFPVGFVSGEEGVYLDWYGDEGGDGECIDCGSPLRGGEWGGEWGGEMGGAGERCIPWRLTRGELEGEIGGDEGGVVGEVGWDEGGVVGIVGWDEGGVVGEVGGLAGIPCLGDCSGEALVFIRCCVLIGEEGGEAIDELKGGLEGDWAWGELMTVRERIG